jgi:hypothetical protein
LAPGSRILFFRRPIIAINFTVKDVIHKVTAKFTPASLPEAKKPYNLRAVLQQYRTYMA